MNHSAFHGSVAAGLFGRAPELAARWLEALRGGRRVRRDEPDASGPPTPAAVVPVVEWLVQAPSAGTEVPPRVVAVIGERILADRAEGRLLEELLIEIQELQQIIFAALHAEVAAREFHAFPSAVSEYAQALARRVSALMALTAGIFNEEVEGERRTERRKLDDFARMVSHEMRTPIGAAFTASRLLQELGDSLPTAERERMLGVVARGLSRATHLLESVLSITLARGTGEGTRPRRSLSAVVEDVLAEVNVLAGTEGVRVDVSTPIPPVLVDAGRVELVLLNLLTNAVKYADRSKPERWVRLTVEPETASGGWRVEVADNAIGIPLDYQQKVFRRFYRAHTGMAEGSGLGLVIAREAAEQLGSELVLESTPGVGTSFSFVLPDPEPGVTPPQVESE